MEGWSGGMEWWDGVVGESGETKFHPIMDDSSHQFLAWTKFHPKSDVSSHQIKQAVNYAY